MSSSSRLVAAAQSGDPDAWRSLYDRHATGLLAWLASLPHTDAALGAEDAAAEAWVTAAAKIGSYTGDDAGFGGWLFTIARNHVANSNRKAARRGTDPTDQLPEPQATGLGSPADVVAGQEHARALLGQLTAREADVVAARDIAGLTVAETAALLGCSSVSVRVTHHRALNRLRRVLADDPAGHGVPATRLSPATG